MFKKLFDEILAAATEDALNDALYRNGGTDRKRDGVDLAYQHGTITWKDHERLFCLAARLAAGMDDRRHRAATILDVEAGTEKRIAAETPAELLREISRNMTAGTVITEIAED